MNTVVYLSNRQLQVVVGKRTGKTVKITKCISEQTPEGSVINGMVMDTETFTDFMKEFWLNNELPMRDIILVINSTEFVGKAMDVPYMSEKRTKDFIVREFMDLSDRNDDIYGYGVFSSGQKAGLRKIYAESVGKRFLKEYVELFAGMGLRVKEIYSGKGSLLSYASMALNGECNDYMLILADGMSLFFTVWVGGEYYHMSHVRCFSGQGSREYVLDMLREVSQMFQFLQAHQVENLPDRVYLAGMSQETLETCREVAPELDIDIPFMMLTKTENWQRGAKQGLSNEALLCIPALSGLYARTKTADFLAASSIDRKRQEELEGIRRGVSIVVLTFTVMLALWGGAFFEKMNKTAELQTLLDQNEQNALSEELIEYDMEVLDNTKLTKKKDALTELFDNLDSYPKVDRSVTEKIKSIANGNVEVEVASYDSNTGNVQLVAYTKNVTEISGFIDGLLKEPAFLEVNYTGYTYDRGYDRWDIHVSCIMAPGQKSTTR